MKSGLAILILLFFLTGCGAGGEGQHAVRNARGKGIISNIEPRPNVKAWTIWFLNDSSGYYCTFDEQLADKAMELFESGSDQVVFTYSSVNAADKEAGSLGLGGCGGEGEGFTGYKLQAIEKFVESTPIPQ